LFSLREKEGWTVNIPVKGASKETVMAKLEEFRSHDIDWRSGRVFGYIYDPGQEAREVGQEAYMRFLSENGLDFSVYPSLLRFENELVSMMAAHLQGDKAVVGNFTSGGTESIILAVKTTRDYFRINRPDIRTPEMILPITAHAAFHKAAHYLNVRVVPVPVNPETFKADPDAVQAAVTPSTILVVGSAPSYAHGVVDPIEALARIALDHDIFCHVDACVGGFMLPYFRRLGEPVPGFDFAVPGVTSISVDLHKYAYTPKGASIILYKNKFIRRFQFFTCSRWTGYTIVNAAVQSSKSGGPMAAAWAVLNFIGDDGYLEIARQTLSATRRMADEIRSIDGLRLLADPEICMLSFTSDTIDLFRLSDEMIRRGWYIQPQLSFDGSPANLHLSIGASNVKLVEPLLADLRDAVDLVRNRENTDIESELDSLVASIDNGRLTDDELPELLALGGINPSLLPKTMAPIHTIMNALSPELRERILTAFVNELFRQV
jgi:sphinganine-1-phosphate aldolase